jgi:hypothetical protein
VTLRTFLQLIAALGLLTLVPAVVEAANSHQDQAVTTSAAVASTGVTNGTAVTNAGQQTPPGQQLPTNLVAPGITGTAAIGKVLTASSGSWDGNGLTYTFQWQRCATDGTGCGPIASAVGSTYTVTSADVGHTLRAAVTATNHNGSTTASSAATAVAAPPPAPAPSTTTTTTTTATTTPPTTTTTKTTTTTTTTTTTPSSGTVYFDGRAKNMTSLYSYESTAGDLSTLKQGQSPQLWSGLNFLNNDIQLASDSRYGQVYSIRTGYDSHTPYYTPTDGRSSEVSRGRPMVLGSWDWYADAFKVKSGWSQPAWADLFQFGYPTLSSPPLSINIDRPSDGVPRFQIYENAGLLANNGSGFYKGPQFGNTNIVAVPFDTWVEIIVGVKWATSSTGEIHVYYRIPSQSSAWQNPINKTGIPTEQYGTTPSGSVNSTFTNSSGGAINVLDHGGLYFGYSSMPSSFPTNYVSQSGLTRSSSLATAQSTFP